MERAPIEYVKKHFLELIIIISSLAVFGMIYWIYLDWTVANSLVEKKTTQTKSVAKKADSAASGGEIICIDESTGGTVPLSECASETETELKPEAERLRVMKKNDEYLIKKNQIAWRAPKEIDDLGILPNSADTVVTYYLVGSLNEGDFSGYDFILANQREMGGTFFRFLKKGDEIVFLGKYSGFRDGSISIVESYFDQSGIY